MSIKRETIVLSTRVLGIGEIIIDITVEPPALGKNNLSG